MSQQLPCLTAFQTNPVHLTKWSSTQQGAIQKVVALLMATRQLARPSATTTPTQELEAWTTDFALPTTVWLAGFFNPQSFLTAIMQSMARKNEWPLDKMCLSVEVTKKTREDMTAPPREGAYVYGLFMEGEPPDHRGPNSAPAPGS